MAKSLAAKLMHRIPKRSHFSVLKSRKEAALRDAKEKAKLTEKRAAAILRKNLLKRISGVSLSPQFSFPLLLRNNAKMEVIADNDALWDERYGKATRFILRPSFEEKEKFPKLQKINFHSVENIGHSEGEIGHMGVRIRWDALRNKPMVLVSVIQQPFLHLLPTQLKRRYRHWDTTLLGKIEELAKASGITEIALITLADKTLYSRPRGFLRTKLFIELPKSRGYKVRKIYHFEDEGISYAEKLWFKEL